MSAFQLNTCSFNISSETDDEDPRVFTHITLKASHPGLGDVASLSAIRILRQFCRGSFLEVMDDQSDELHQFSVAVFDKFGRVRPWLVEPGSRRGSGCWGNDLNVGDLIYVLDMSVKEEYRNHGLGSRMIQKLVELAHVGKDDKLACWPTPIGVTDKAEWAALKEKQVAFVRKNGFRRIGRTGFFACSPDPSHPSRALSIADDADERGSNFDQTAEDQLNQDEIVRKYPLHVAIVSIKQPEVAGIIRASYEADPSSIHKADASGFTPIHVALQKANVHAVNALVDLGVADDLKNADNAEDMTPLELLLSTMRSSREFMESLIGSWTGYSTEELTCEFLAKRALGMTTASDLEGFIAKHTFGCSCGQCAGGWLSKRMRFRLQCQAGLTKDNMSMEMDQFQRGVPRDQSMMFDNASSYLPPHLHQSVFKSFYAGFQSIFDVIYTFLDKTDQPLNRQTISHRSLGHPGVGFYLGKGGKVDYALDAITHCASEQSPLGDGTFDEMWEEDEDYTGLPTCANDLEFGLVRRMIGLDPSVRWGPYLSMMDMDVEDDDDEVDDDGDRFGTGGVLPSGQALAFQEVMRRVAAGQL